MSSDMMQTLSGSSLLSLSFGTLPAGKAGMNLDANPFASQLALMTGPEAAFGSGVLPVAADGGFALALADAVEAPVGQGVTDLSAGVAEPLVAQPLAQQEMPKAVAARTAVARIAVSEVSEDIAPLPADATPSEILEAAMNANAPKAPAKAVDDKPVVIASKANAALLPVASPEAAAPVAPAVPAAAQAAVEPAKPAAASAPLVRAATTTDVSIREPVRPHPVVTTDEIAQATPALVLPTSAVQNADQPVAEPQAQRPRRSAHAVEAAPAVVDLAMIAPAITPVTLPVAAAPDAPAPETGTTRVAISAAPAPVSSAPVSSLPGDNVAAPIADAPTFTDPASTPQQPVSADKGVRAMPTPPRAPVAAPPSTGASETVVASAEPTHVAQPTQARATPAHTTAEPAPVTAVPLAAAPAIAAAQPIEAITTAPAPAAAPAPAPAPAMVSPGVASPVAQTSVAPAATDLPLAPVAPAAPVAQATPATSATPIPAVDPTAIPAAASVTPAAAATVSAQPLRAVTSTPRAIAGTTAQRAVQAAVQSPQPAQALAALFNLGDAGSEPAPVEGMTEAPIAPRIEAVQPSWVAALNAVTLPVASPAVQALSAPAGAAAPQAPLETLAFDAAFIGNVETQISRVMGGAQMVRMQIMPEHLGRIDIEMLAGPDRDQVRLVTEHDAVRDTLVQSQVRLEQDLRQNGQRHAEVTVELRQQSAGTQGGSAQQQQRGQAGSEGSAQRDAAQRQNAGTTSDTQTPAQRRPRGNVRYA